MCPFGRPLCYTCIQKVPCLTAEGFCTQYRKLFLYFFGFPFREDDLVDKEEDYHRNAAVEHRGADVIDKVRHQQARNRRSHAVGEVNEAGDQTECQHQAICLARSTLPRNTKLRWMGDFTRQIHRRKNSWILHLLSSHPLPASPSSATLPQRLSNRPRWLISDCRPSAVRWAAWLRPARIRLSSRSEKTTDQQVTSKLPAS